MNENNIVKPEQIFSNLAICQAVFKAIKDSISTKGGTGTRAIADSYICDLYENVGVSKVDLKVNGSKVGTLSVSVSDDPQICDQSAYVEWLKDGEYVKYRPTIHLDMLSEETVKKIIELAEAENAYSVEYVQEVPQLRDIARRVGDCAVSVNTGEVVPGIVWKDHVTGTRISGCKPEDVSDALGGGANDNMTRLLCGEIM